MLLKSWLCLSVIVTWNFYLHFRSQQIPAELATPISMPAQFFAKR
jgi:hypothetical protein